MFDFYPDKIYYISKDGTKDMFGYTNNEPVEKFVRYVGGKDVQVENNNNFSIEHRLEYHSPFEIFVGDKIIKNKDRLEVKKVEEIRDIFFNTLFWRFEVV